jgi:ABC-type branched-subunit amino acid transport system ATPase component
MNTSYSIGERSRTTRRRRALALAQRVYIINNGHIVHEGPAQEIKAQPDILQRYLGA